MNALARPADQVTDQIADGLQRLAVVLVHVLAAEPEPDLIVHRPQVKQHVSALWSIHVASLRTLRRAGYDRRDPFAVLITMPIRAHRRLGRVDYLSLRDGGVMPHGCRQTAEGMTDHRPSPWTRCASADIGPDGSAVGA